MCLFGGATPAPAPKKAEFDDAPPVVTGRQTGVDDPKDTAKATEKLKMSRKKEEETYVDPTVNTNLDRTESLLKMGIGTGGNSSGVVARNKRSAKLRGKTKSSGNRSGTRV